MVVVAVCSVRSIAMVWSTGSAGSAEGGDVERFVVLLAVRGGASSAAWTRESVRFLILGDSPSS